MADHRHVRVKPNGERTIETVKDCPCSLEGQTSIGDFIGDTGPITHSVGDGCDPPHVLIGEPQP